MRVIVCGSGHADYSHLVAFELTQLHERQPIRVLAHGGGQGVCAAAEEWARLNSVSVVRYPPNWVRLGKKAEAMRNEFMLEDSRPDMVIAFPGGDCTADLVRRALGHRLAVYSVPARDVPQQSRVVQIRKASARQAA
ncbi:Protein of unknown function [Rhizobiales bacterium GAS188]|nr:Protein of unknown function [Rhizobiales bacterium GAS188]